MTDTEFTAAHRAAGHAIERWSNGPHAVYALHEHPYRKHLLVVSGAITFTVRGAARALQAGEALIIPAGTPHAARVGPDGVGCLEAHLSDAARRSLTSGDPEPQRGT